MKYLQIFSWILELFLYLQRNFNTQQILDTESANNFLNFHILFNLQGKVEIDKEFTFDSN